MDKPLWKDSPEWAMWLAQDRDGQWGWFELKPRKSPYADTWFWEGGQWDGNDCNVQNDDWQSTLEPRPA